MTNNMSKYFIYTSAKNEKYSGLLYNALLPSA